MNSPSAMIRRLFEVFPLLAALAFHALAFQRWALALPVVLLLVSTIPFRLPVSASTRWFLIAGGAGLIAGLAMLATGPPPSGPLPPVVTSALVGMLIGVGTLFSITGRAVAAWIAAWVLVALSGTVEPSISLNVALIAFMAGLLIALVSFARVFEGGPSSILALTLFAIVVSGSTAGIVAGAKHLDVTLQRSLQAWFVGDRPTGRTGIGAEVIVGSRSSITLSHEPVLELSSQVKRLRVHVMDRFDGRRWSTSSELRTARESLADVPVRPESTRELEMVLLEDMGDTLPAPAGIWEVRGTTPRVEGGWVLRGQTEDVILRLTGDSRERLPPEPAPKNELLAVPDELRAALGPLAEELMLGHETSHAKAVQVERFFQQHFAYSLDTDLTGRQHPLIIFVEERRPAYCIYFASAMAVMLRTQGIPSRIVTGFAAGEVNPITGRVTIRQRDAHAWVEAWSPEDQRFVAFDPTPGTSREQVIGTAGGLGIVSACADAIVSTGRRVWLTYRQDPTGALVVLAKSPISWILLSLLVALWLRRHWAGRSPSVHAPSLEAADPRLRRSYRCYLKALRTAGVTPRPSETDDELIRRLAEVGGPQLAARAANFITIYRRARYRSEPPDERLMQIAQLD